MDIALKTIRLCLGILLALTADISIAQTVDMYDFGMRTAMAVRTAIWADYYNKQCKGESIPIYQNATDAMLRRIDNRSVVKVLANASKELGASPDQLVAMTKKQFADRLIELGGCKSRKGREEGEGIQLANIEANKYLLSVALLWQQSKGRNIFR